MARPNPITATYFAMRDMVFKYFSDEKSGRAIVLLGGILLLATLSFIVFIPCPTSPQYSIIRIVSAAGLSALSFGLFLFQTKESVSLKLLSLPFVFLISYKVNPATLVVNDDCSLSYRYLEGRVLLRGEPLEGVIMTFPEENHRMITNSQGEFFLPYYDNDQHNAVIKVQYHHYDTTIDLSKIPDKRPFIISLPKSLKSPSSRELRNVIQNRIADVEQMARATHQGLLDNDQGVEVTLNQLQRFCVSYEQLQSSYRNYYAYTNGPINTKYRKHLLDLGIEPWDYRPENSLGLKGFKSFLLKNTGTGKAIDLRYGFLNQLSPEFEILSTHTDREGYHRVKVHYTEPVRYVYVTLAYNPSSQWKRRREMQFLGLHPTETYVLKNSRNGWKLEGIE